MGESEQHVVFGAMSPRVRQAVQAVSDEIGLRVVTEEGRTKVRVRDAEQAYWLGLEVGRRLQEAEGKAVPDGL